MPVAPVPDAAVPKVWVAAHGLHDDVAATAAKLGASLDRGDRPGPDSLILVAPLGRDATMAALAERVDPTRTVVRHNDIRDNAPADVVYDGSGDGNVVNER